LLSSKRAWSKGGGRFGLPFGVQSRFALFSVRPTASELGCCGVVSVGGVVAVVC
jgi:hypothetical protein